MFLYGFAGLLLCFVFGYFIITTSAFFKIAILPRISHTLGAKVTVADASISPFSHIYLNQVKIAVPGAEPFFNAESVRLDYSLMRIIGGNLKVDDVLVESPSLTIVENADGTLNIDALRKQPGSTSPAPPAASQQSSKPTRLELKNIAIKNATVHCIANLPGGGTRTIELRRE